MEGLLATASILDFFFVFSRNTRFVWNMSIEQEANLGQDDIIVFAWHEEQGTSTARPVLV